MNKVEVAQWVALFTIIGTGLVVSYKAYIWLIATVGRWYWGM